MAEKELTIIELTEENIESMIYEIRGQKVMLDFDLARIYGYTTRDFNNQVKHNIERFDSDFRFQLTKEEVAQISVWKNSTAIMQTKGIKGGRTTLPYAFTEQGIYMLMTVLKGELAVKQSKALIRLFKKMKDYIVENNQFIDHDTSLISSKFSLYDKRFEKVEEKLKIVMDNFIDPTMYKQFYMLNGQKIEADLAYQTIYSLAKHTIHIVDDYVGVKTLHLLLSANKDIQITIISDNVSRNPIQPEYIEEFKEETGIDLIMKPSNNLCHDRFIIIDYSTDNEMVYLCGSSSKDAGNKMTTILEIKKEYINHTFFDELIKQFR